MKRQLRKYWAAVLTSAGISTSLCAAIYWNSGQSPFSSPRARTAASYCDTGFHAPYYKANRINALAPDTVLIGSSKVHIGLRAEHSVWGPSTVYNFGLSGGNAYTSLRSLQHAVARGKLERVVVGLDSYAGFAKPRLTPPDFREADFNVTPTGSVNRLRGWDRIPSVYTFHAVKHVLGALLRQPLQCRRRIDPRGQTIIDPLLPNLSERAWTEQFDVVERAFVKLKTTSTATALDFTDYSALLRLAHRQNLDLSLLVLPRHIRLEALEFRLDCRSRNEQWLERLAEINEAIAREQSKPPFPLWNFQLSGAAVAEPLPLGDGAPMGYWMDPVHFLPALGDQILERLHGQNDAMGEPLISKTAAALIRRQRQELQRWLRDHPVDAQQLEQLFDSAAPANWTRRECPN